MDELILVGNSRILLKEDSGTLRLPLEDELPLRNGAEHFSFPGFKAYDIMAAEGNQEDMVDYGLREAWAILPPGKYAAVVKGAELLNWSAGERFCPRDGAPLSRASEISKSCPVCGREYFPRLNPAVVVLVLKGEEALLVHPHTLSNPKVETLVAGFVETGESLEECVRREIKEETDLEVEDIRYFGSQPWPWPYQLMVGFTARYAGGELRFADGEITSGGFYTRDNLPVLPTMPSLSRVIIEEWRKGNI